MNQFSEALMEREKEMFLPGIAMVRKQGDMGKTKEGNPVPFMVR
jgi:hypothetical protein